MGASLPALVVNLEKKRDEQHNDTKIFRSLQPSTTGNLLNIPSISVESFVRSSKSRNGKIKEEWLSTEGMGNLDKNNQKWRVDRQVKGRGGGRKKNNNWVVRLKENIHWKKKNVFKLNLYANNVEANHNYRDISSLSFSSLHSPLSPFSPHYSLHSNLSQSYPPSSVLCLHFLYYQQSSFTAGSFLSIYLFL